MAGPLIELLQGLRARRQRRRSGWGGGDSPGMRNIINPLDSQDMADRAQGVDISSAMPSTRLETQISQPAAESFVTSQLPQPAAPSVAAPSQIAAEFDQPAQRSSPFMTAAGSNAASSPISTQQCPGGVCPTGPSRGLSASDYGITLAPGETLLRVNEQPSAGPSQTMAPQPMGAPVGGSPAMATGASPSAAPFDPASAFSAWQGFMQNAAADPKSTNWAAAGYAAAQQADSFFKLHQATANPSWKVYYGQQFAYWQRESANAFKAHQLAQNLAPRQQMAERAMERGSLKSKFQEAYDFLTTPNMSINADDRAAAYARTLNPKLTDEELAANPTFNEARQVANAAEIAYSAALAASGSENQYPWGTEEDRAAGASPAWNAVRGYYGGMDIADAADEIERRFKPAYLQFLSQSNLERSPGERMGEGELRELAELHTKALVSELAYEKDPNIGAEPQPQQQPQSPPPAAQQTDDGYGWFSHPQTGKWSGVW